MDYLEPFSIKLFNGKNVGSFDYQYKIDNRFFDCFEDSLIKEGNYDVDLKVDISERMIILNFDIEGEYSAICDRCLVDITIPSSISYRVFLKYGILEEDNEDNDFDDVIYIEEGSRRYNVANIINQLIALSRPMSNLYDCENDPNPKCDFKMLEYLNNAEKDDGEENDSNPMWDDLKNIFSK